jgi:hypothetical protein
MNAHFKLLKFGLACSLVFLTSISAIAVAQIAGERVQRYDLSSMNANPSTSRPVDTLSYGEPIGSSSRVPASRGADYYTLPPTELQLLTRTGNDPRDSAVSAVTPSLRRGKSLPRATAQTNASISGDTLSHSLTPNFGLLNIKGQAGADDIYRSPW